MKKFNRKETEKKVKKLLKSWEKEGLDIEKITEGKDIKRLSWSSKSFEQMKKRAKRVRQHPKVVEESKEIDKKLEKKRLEQKIQNQKRQKRKYITQKTQAIMKFNYEDVKPTKLNIKKITLLKANDFLSKYFKSSLPNVALMERVNKLSKRFGNRLDLLNEFINDSTAIDFQYEIDGMVFTRDEFESDFADSWDDMMEKRLEKMEMLLETKKYRI